MLSGGGLGALSGGGLRSSLTLTLTLTLASTLNPQP